MSSCCFSGLSEVVREEESARAVVSSCDGTSGRGRRDGDDGGAIVARQ